MLYGGGGVVSSTERGARAPKSLLAPTRQSVMHWAIWLFLDSGQNGRKLESPRHSRSGQWTADVVSKPRLRDADKKSERYEALRLHVSRAGELNHKRGSNSGGQAAVPPDAEQRASIDRAKDVRNLDGRWISDKFARR